MKVQEMDKTLEQSKFEQNKVYPVYANLDGLTQILVQIVCDKEN